MEIAIEVCTFSNCVDSRIDESYRRAAVSHRLLIYQRDEASPARRCVTGATRLIVGARSVVARDVVEVSFRGHIGQVAYGR